MTVYFSLRILSRLGYVAMPILAITCCCIPAMAGPAKVLSIGDGDTITILDSKGRVTVRLACIDAPETAQSPYGAKARSALQDMTPVGAKVTLQGSKRDRYGRTVAEVFRDGTNINLELVRRGDAFVYRQYLAGCDRNAYLSAEESAAGKKQGVWSVPGGITRPWEWRRGGAKQQTSKPAPSGTATRRYRCKEVGSWTKAQELLKQGHTYLDGDRDGVACESLR